MKFIWSNRDDGVVCISRDGNHYEVPTIHVTNPSYNDYLRALHYLPIVKKFCGRLSPNVAIGIIFAENSREKDISRMGAVGIMQVLPSTANMTTMQLQHVEKNIEAGCKYLRFLATLPGADLPAIASMYNAGLYNGRPHSSEESPFGFAESPGYIVRVISASNEFSLRGVN